MAISSVYGAPKPEPQAIVAAPAAVVAPVATSYSAQVVNHAVSAPLVAAAPAAYVASPYASAAYVASPYYASPYSAYYGSYVL